MDKGSLPTVKTAAALFRKICYENKDKLMAGIIVAGWDPVRGGQVYSIPLGGTCVEQDYAIGGSGSTYIYGLVDATYHKGMSRDECVTFVKQCLSHAMARDGSSGGVARVVAIDDKGVERDFTAGDKLPFMINAEGGGAESAKAPPAAVASGSGAAAM